MIVRAVFEAKKYGKHGKKEFFMSMFVSIIGAFFVFSRFFKCFLDLQTSFLFWAS